MNLRSVTRCVLLASSVLASAASAQEPYPRALAACQKSFAQAPSDEPTTFKCNWGAILDGAPGASLSGYYDYLRSDLEGALTILETGEGPALVGVFSISKSMGHICAASLHAERIDDSIVAEPSDAPGCRISIRSSNTVNVVDLTATPECRFFCGMGSDMEGQYRLKN